MSREGDWMCAACQHLNFKKRDACQRCSCPKYETSADVSTYGLNRTEVLAGDWNDGTRMRAYDAACLFLVGRVVIGYSRIGCGRHNYASRAECYKCKTPKDFGEPSSK
ncbi:hypothetical protein HAX54_015094 [Datura stramonium]|uniref:RanBP2-type domain-containing protein n=1 Tax=Datura stramonium TaxID=4076 RepID=A0ABS8TRF2_DATST|nr:hypothetical protein [Datura stramonium]